MLVAAMSTNKRITATKKVPMIPNKVADNGVQQCVHTVPFCAKAATSNASIKYNVATPTMLVSSVEGIAITAVICRNAATIPIIKLATNANPVHSYLNSQLKNEFYL